MATALSATFQPATLTDPPRVLLEVTGGPSRARAYDSNFATVDGWSGASGTFVSDGRLGIVAVGSTATWSRTVTGLTIGHTYKFYAVVIGTHGSIALGVAGKTPGAYLKPPDGVGTLTSYEFTATATSHDLQFLLKQSNGSVNLPAYQVSSAWLTRTTAWLGTTIRRTDANGTDVEVREGPEGQDTDSGGAMTVTDYEHALTGTVVYTVTDGDGVTATDSVTPDPAPGAWLSVPATADPEAAEPPVFLDGLRVVGYDEASTSNGSVHTIIGRRDPVANPGPLVYRAGMLQLWCPDYATAAAVRELFEAGDVAQLRQTEHAGMDMHLTATEVTVRPDTTGALRWLAAVMYQQVGAP